MFLIILISFVLIICLALIVKLVWRHIPELKAIDLPSIPREQRVNTKSKILEAKFMRQRAKTKGRLAKVFDPVKSGFGELSIKAQERVKALEKKYRRHEHVEAARTKSIEELFVEAKDLIRDEDYIQAEKNLIEVISRDRKNILAYELLSDIYRRNKNYDQAEEVLNYLIKLKSLKFRKSKTFDALKKERMEETDAAILAVVDVDNELSRYYDDLGKVYESMERKDKALDCYLKANAIEPNNPKFLDKVIDLAISVKDKGLAKKTYRRLKEINPENAKLSLFKEVLDKM